MTSKVRPVILLAMLFALASASVLPSTGHAVTAAAQSRPPADTSPVPDQARVAASLVGTPLMFIENVGQLKEGARFQVLGRNGAIYLAEDSLSFTVMGSSATQLQPKTEDPRNRGVNLEVTFPGANPNPLIEPFDRLDTQVSYFIGNDPTKWRVGVPVWGGVRYVDLYPGIDLEVTGEEGRLVQRIVVRGGDLGAVRLRVEGADKLAVAGDSLQVDTAVGTFTMPLLQLAGDGSSNPVIPSGEPKVRGQEVLAPFVTSSGPQARTAAVGPFDLSYATFLGGSGTEIGRGIAVDGSGAAYVTGYTEGNNSPTTPGAYDTSFNGGQDAFVAKLNPAGSALVYATFLGGSGADQGYAIAVEGSGAAYVTGLTGPSDFPTTPGAYDTSFNGGSNDAFVAKLNPAGSALVYATLTGRQRRGRCLCDCRGRQRGGLRHGHDRLGQLPNHTGRL
ncbi:MAG: SBBP repeat-containing protein [Dehalococcoidia bacterium]|nr:SBBP repeat-containing protein [Dehalococcoidia bacterium]